MDEVLDRKRLFLQRNGGEMEKKHQNDVLWRKRRRISGMGEDMEKTAIKGIYLYDRDEAEMQEADEEVLVGSSRKS